MNFLADVVGAGFKGALIKFFRLLFFAIIVLIVVYVVGIFTNKKASALTYKGTLYDTYQNGNDRSSNGTLTGNGQKDNYYYLNAPKDYTTYDFVGFRINQFSTYFADLGYTNSCTGTYNESTGRISYGCTGNYGGSSYVSEAYTLTANAIWRAKTSSNSSDNFTLPCWFSSEYEGTFICPVEKNSNLIGIDVIVKYSTLEPFSYNLSMTGLKFALNSDNTDIVVQQGQTNTILQDSDITTSQTNSTTALTGIQTTMETKLKGTNELTQMVMAPLTILTNVAGSTCQPITWNIPLVNYEATIPCMSTIYNTHFSQILALFSTVITGIFAYRTVVKLVSTIKDSLDAENDKLEVLDL